MKYLVLSIVISMNSFFLGSMIAADKTYPVIHTQREWISTMSGLGYIQVALRQSDMPANIAFTCDSICQSQINDINRQVYAAMQADSANKKGK